ncbi:hypothetical protein K443DRAFT_1 [Laccaria amethystina LaAM-08-1]|uniref:Uncharacterized protein n=1 Tax=Laccaria amethystina LaAM-08-1 TaxID=1095629 RepID=A0A0C9XCM9_9AGAR|nr:hypothetical protein K443DRAFT_1 [Laccaria amethystina LaAM-08-1]
MIGNWLAAALESVPEEISSPHLPFTAPLSLKLIEEGQSHVRSKSYANAKEFNMDMACLFLKAHLHVRNYTVKSYFSKLYQALTSPNPPQGAVLSSSTNCTTLRAGPRNVKPAHGASDSDTAPSVTSYRVPTKDQIFVDEVTYKGWSMKLADWLHLANPDDPSRSGTYHPYHITVASA